MSYLGQNVRIVMDYENLTDPQKVQFKHVIMEGVKGKLFNTLHGNAESTLKIIDIWMKYGFVPMKKTFSAVDRQTENVLAILLLNDFHKPNLVNMVRCIMNVIRAIGLKKALKLAYNFLALDNLNKEENPDNIKSEIYLVVTSESQRGKGLGTILINHVLDYLRSVYESELSQNTECKVKLLVFGKNPALKLYERLGFKQVSSVDTPQMAQAFGGDYDRLIRMEKTL